MGVALRELPDSALPVATSSAARSWTAGSTHCGYSIHGSHLLRPGHDHGNLGTPAGPGATGKFVAMILIERDSPARDDVRLLLSEHLADMFATSPAESVHALDHSALSAPSISFWTAREDGALLGCGALKLLPSPAGTARHGEIKSIRTTATARGRGVATLMIRHILEDARARNLGHVFLETGTEDYFAPARRLYARYGFTECPPFADYVLDPNSVFMELRLQA